MKKFLLLLAIMAITGLSIRLKAQTAACSVSDLFVVIKNVTSSPGGCQVTMDVTFTGDFNGGNKFAFIHLWEIAPVNNYPTINYNNPPTAAQLGNAVANLVIENPGKPFAALYNVYPPAPSVPVLFAGVGFSKSGTTYTLTNVIINLSTCGEPVTIKGDSWSSQSDDGQVVHCSSLGEITLLLNDPIITGIKQCAKPRLLNLGFANDHPTLNETVTASVFIDVNSNGIIDAGDIDITNSLSPALPGSFNVAANSSQLFTDLAYPPYSSQAIYDSKPIIVRANATAPGAATVTMTKTGITFLGSCSLLPVTFKSFTAVRKHSGVILKWETASEQNNDGFAIERNTNGSWQQLAFVPTQAPGGNSGNTLSYQYDDLNTIQGMTQYRIRQVDLDGNYKYSEIRSVRGEEQTAKTIVYPNPSNNGKVNVVFEETKGVRDVSLIDISGKVVKQWNGISNNNIQIDNLSPGMYNLRVVIRESGEQSVNKFIVNRH